jgi:hypothetical protein
MELESFSQGTDASEHLRPTKVVLQSDYEIRSPSERTVSLPPTARGDAPFKQLTSIP